MRQDKTFARILLIFPVANVVIAAPSVVRPRHLDVAKAASEKRATGSGNGATDDWAWFHHMPSELPESSSVTANRITTQASGSPGSGNGATSDLPPKSPSSSHGSPTNEWAWLDKAASPGSSSTAANRITTQSGNLPPHQGSPASLTGSDLDWLQRTERARKILVFSGFLSMVGGSVALGYEIAQ